MIKIRCGGVSKKFKYFIITGERFRFYRTRPKSIPGGYMDHNGRRFIGRDVILGLNKLM